MVTVTCFFVILPSLQRNAWIVTESRFWAPLPKPLLITHSLITYVVAKALLNNQSTTLDHIFSQSFCFVWIFFTRREGVTNELYFFNLKQGKIIISTGLIILSAFIPRNMIRYEIIQNVIQHSCLSVNFNRKRNYCRLGCQCEFQYNR
jgi:hypothetical protein